MCNHIEGEDFTSAGDANSRCIIPRSVGRENRFPRKNGIILRHPKYSIILINKLADREASFMDLASSK